MTYDQMTITELENEVESLSIEINKLKSTCQSFEACAKISSLPFIPEFELKAYIDKRKAVLDIIEKRSGTGD